MKKIHNTKNHFFDILILVFVCLFLFNSGCGIDEYIVIAEPSQVDYLPNYDSQFDFRYFQFQTNENTGSDGSETYQGTEVYYKIYNNCQTMINEYAALETIADDDDKKATSYTSMINKGFKILKCIRNDGKTTNYLIPAAKSGDSKQTVYIRLTDYLGGIEGYNADIQIDKTSIGKPVRNENNYTFNFGNSGEDDMIPVSGDTDCSISSSATSSGTWYVSMFAVGVGIDSTLTQVYSNILYLGNVAIVESSDMN